MEGRGRYDCALVGGSDASRAVGDSAQCDASSEQCAPLVLRVKPGTTYRLRLASVASLASLNFQIQVRLPTTLPFYLYIYLLHNLRPL
jgi:L-ascorbate oxidase